MSLRKGSVLIAHASSGQTATITWYGRTMSIVAWAHLFGIPSSTLRSRIQRGWPVERALTPREGVELWLKESWAGGFRHRSIVFDSDGSVSYPQGIPMTNETVKPGAVATPELARRAYSAYGYFKVDSEP